MGRHRRTSAPPTAPGNPPGERPARRRPARTGLLGASAAMAVGAVAMASGLLPAPGGTAGGYTYGGGDSTGNLAQPDGSPATTAPVYTSAMPSPATSPSRAAGTPEAGGARRPAASPSATRAAASPPASAPAAPASPAPTTAAATPSATARAIAAAAGQVLALVNTERAKAGCHPLTADAKLTELAQNFSDEMAARGFFDHTDPDGRSPWDRAALLGITDLGGENIARGQADAAAVMASWMNSPGHRANILNCQYHTLGVGVHFEAGGPWWTQDFGF